MRKPFLILAAVFLSSSGSHLLAQSSQTKYPKGWVHALGGFGATLTGNTSAFLHFGGGGEALLKGGFGAGLELGVAGLFDEGNFGETAIGLFSPGLLYAFNRERKLVPLVTGGYTMFFRNGIDNGVFVGGGANYWLKKRIGLRFEVRDNVIVGNGAYHLVEGRVAILFRLPVP